MTGLAVSLVYPDEVSQLKQVEKLIGMKIPQGSITIDPTLQLNDKELTQRPPRPPRPQPKGPAGERATSRQGAPRPARKPAAATGADGNTASRPAGRPGQPQGQRKTTRCRPEQPTPTAKPASAGAQTSRYICLIRHDEPTSAPAFYGNA